MNKALIAILAAVLVSGGLWLLLSNNDPDTDQTPETTQETQQQETIPTANEEQPSEDQAKTVEVLYTADGFEPRSITINSGDTVRWTNESGSAMWVASDDHPVHSDLPGFDQLRTGDSYSFTFAESGTWGYHNHENDRDTGTVIVN